VAGAEFRAFVRARSFLIGLVLPPVLGAVAGFAAWASRPPAEPGPAPPSRIAILDPTEWMFRTLEVEAARWNANLGSRVPFELERVEAPADPEAIRRLETRVHGGGLQALVEIPVEPDAASADPVRVRVVGREEVRGELVGWLEDVVQEEIRTRAIRRSGLPAEVRSRLERQVVVQVRPPAPAEGEASGVAPDPQAAPKLTRRLILELLGPYQRLAIAGPLGFILFFAVSVAAAPLFQAVLEEKTSRVSEILLSAVSPFELMLGKLLGSLAACGIAALTYTALLLAIMVLVFGAALPVGLLALFAVYLVLSLLLWGAIFLAIGAACADLKDAQNLMLPVVLVQVLPLIFVSSVLAAPEGGMARFLSLFPPTASLAMLIRLGLDPAPQTLEIAISLFVLAASAFACVWAAGRVLRVGLLVQGRSASLREVVRWVRAG
jgi:ABC-2 type transport system permease protein